MGSGVSKDGLEATPLETLTDHNGCINCMALSEDSSLLVSGSDDNTLRLWSTKTEPIEDLGVLEGHTGFIQCATVYDTYVITGSKDMTIKKWDMASTLCEFTFQGHTGRVNRLICTGEFIFSTSHDKTARAWLFDTRDVHDPAEAGIRVFEGHTGIVSPIIFVPGRDMGVPDENGYNINPADLVITASFDNTARAWSFDTAQCLKTFKGHKKPITSMDTDPNGHILYTGSQDQSIIAWDISRGTKMKVVEDAHAGAILFLRVVNRFMYTTGTDHTARCWVREGLENTRTFRDHTDSVPCARFHNGVLYTACNDGIVRAFNAKSGSLKRKFIGHESAVTCLAVCVNQQGQEVFTRLLTGSNDSTLRVWNATGISEQLPSVGEAEDHEYSWQQDQRLEELNRHLDGYLPDDPLSKSSASSVGAGSKTTLEADTLGIIDVDT
ncbi:WD repeat-containing protein 86-like [Procambarus clarkii]|uniref:WD repeat-containing protein 86 n=1 Tax=Procambarus clarkii TaxID=6728 RepID=UPI001E67111A|nr:WD repeat-containing protein 86-like [Procambarus clarkii]